MTRETSKKVRDLNPVGRKPYGVYSRFNEYFNLLLNQVKVIDKATGLELDYPAQIFLKRAIFDLNACGFDRITNKWYYVYGEGLNELGNPTTLTLVTANGRAFRRPASYTPKEDGAYMIKGLPADGVTLSQIIRETTDFMTACDVAMRQNLEACKTPYIVVCKNEDLRLSFEQALQQKQEGQAVVLVSEELGDGLKAVDIGVEYLVDKFRMSRDAERDTLLNKLGILTANDDKRERVQSAEVNATIGQASDYIYMVIDNFNDQMDTYGLPYEMQFNGSMEEIYLNEGEADAPNNTPVDFSVNDAERL